MLRRRIGWGAFTQEAVSPWETVSCFQGGVNQAAAFFFLR